MNLSFLNNEMIMSLIQATQMQMTVYNEFLKLCGGDVEQARVQTQIYMNAFMNPSAKKKEGDETK